MVDRTNWPEEDISVMYHNFQHCILATHSLKVSCLGVFPQPLGTISPVQTAELTIQLKFQVKQEVTVPYSVHSIA